MSLLEEPLARFLEELSSDEPMPGGGAVAALAGALAAGLVAMVANLTLGKKGYEAVQKEMKKTLEEAEELRERLAGLVEADTAAFKGVMAAYRLPKNDPARPQAIEEALKTACTVPLETAERCLRALELAEVVAVRGNKNAVTDAGAAAAMAYSGLETALLNVAINLQAIKDEGFKREYRRRGDKLAATGKELKERTLHLVQERMGK
jgi:formiminotetrahydrofolate cyclodeaminase